MLPEPKYPAALGLDSWAFRVFYLPVKTFRSLAALATLVLVATSDVSSGAQAQDAAKKAQAEKAAKCVAGCKEACDTRFSSMDPGRTSACMDHCKTLYKCY